MRIKKTSQYIEGGASISNEYGTSNENGYTQEYINDKIANLLPIKKWSIWPNSSSKTITTDISFGGTRSGGRTLFAVVNGHSSTGDATFSKMYMIRMGYSGSTLSAVEFASSTGSINAPTLTFGVNSNNLLTLTSNWSSGCIRLYIITFQN